MKKVIIVEDDAALQEILLIILKVDEYEVQTYSDAAPIKTGQFEKPDLFILDWRLPGNTDGIQLCKRLKKDPKTKDIPVIMISASPNIATAAKKAGADGAIEKPFRIKAIRDCVRKHLNR